MLSMVNADAKNTIATAVAMVRDIQVLFPYKSRIVPIGSSSMLDYVFFNSFPFFMFHRRQRF